MTTEQAVPSLPWFPALRADNRAPALVDAGRVWSYADLYAHVDAIASGLLAGRADLGEERIALLLPASPDYTGTLLGIWRAGGIAVPLSMAAALPELEHALATAGVTRLVLAAGTLAAVPGLSELCKALAVDILPVAALPAAASAPLPVVAPERRAMILFTSGTTSKPKGVVSTHRNLHAQITTLLTAWAWQADDRIPLFLPLHHIHGIVNVLCCALWAGARVELYPAFDLPRLLTQIAAGAYTLFMAVPTIYVKLVAHIDTLPTAEREAVLAGFRAQRLQVSGSAACPVKLFGQWQALTGQCLLERYGMTEIGMALSNPYTGERRAGAVGLPLPGVEVALFDEQGVMIEAEALSGEIRVRGETVFLEYWNNPEATAASFVDGWFCTGDIAVREEGYYRIMGRASVDIIKSGGYKLSALEIEGVLLTHPAIAECAVVGLADDTWGEAVGAFVVLAPESSLTLAALRQWCSGRMSAYKIPKQLFVLGTLPRNAMGKVTKPALRDLV